MRVLILNDFDEMVGGAEVYDHQLAESLRNRGHSVDIYGGEESNRYRQFLQSWFSIRHYLGVKEKIRNFDPDVIFAHQIGGNISPSVLLASKQSDRNVVLKVPNLTQYSLTFNPSEGLSNINNIKKVAHRPLVKRLTDCWIAPSQIAADQLNNGVGVSTDIHLIRNPVPWNEPFQNRVGPLQRGNVNFLFVGRIHESKGFDVLIRAFETVVATFPEAELEIIGDGPNRDELNQSISESEYRNNITFHGHVPHERIKDHYVDADIFVLPSVIRENCPLTILEAMGVGLPVITTNFGGQQELVDDRMTGFLVVPNSAGSLATAMSSLCKDPYQIRRMSQNVSNKASQFSRTQHVNRVENLLESYA